jgi:CubicO group peptidase (beta-lactamase class C family)
MPSRHVVLVICLVLLPASIVAGAEPTRAELSAKLHELLLTHVSADGPGAIVIVARDGKIVGQAALGHADVEKKLPLDSTTVFDLASCTKQFTAMAVMILAERGKLSFDDDARRYLPELAVREPPIHLSELLHMTSGLPDYEKLLDHLEDKTNLDVLHAVAAQPLLFPTGSKFNYCDTNYVLLATIVERVSGQTFGHFLKEEVFEPAGMKQSVLLESPGQAIENRAVGYSRDKAGAIKPSREDTRTFGDGQVMTSALDLVMWDRALREGKLVKPAMLSRAFTSGTLADGKPCGYGFGWFIGGMSGGRVAEHGGKWAGTSTYISRHLDDGLTVIVLSNLEQFPARKVAAEAAALATK